MISYWEPMNAWISGKNPDKQGMPSTNLTGDPDVCTCKDCVTALFNALGTNLKDLPKI